MADVIGELAAQDGDVPDTFDTRFGDYPDTFAGRFSAAPGAIPQDPFERASLRFRRANPYAEKPAGYAEGLAALGGVVPGFLYPWARAGQAFMAAPKAAQVIGGILGAGGAASVAEPTVERAWQQSERKRAGFDYDPGPILQTALHTAAWGMPEPNTVGAFGGRPPRIGDVAEIPPARMGGLVEPPAPQGIRAYHGSPHDFERFDINKIGTGEGAQVYGHGLYFAEAEPTALSYKNAPRVTDMDWPVAGTDLKVPAWVARSAQTPRGLEEVRQNFIGRVAQSKQELAAGDHNAAERVYHTQRVVDALNAVKAGAELKKPGHMYEVNINARPEQFLDWDKPLAKMSPEVQNALNKAWLAHPEAHARQSGEQIYGQAEINFHQSGRGHLDRQVASERLRDAGIPGIKYLDQGSRAKTEFFSQPAKTLDDAAEQVRLLGHQGLIGSIKGEPGNWSVQGYRPSDKGTSNYVLFDDKLIDILRKYGIVPPVAAGAMGSLASQDQYQQ